MRGYLAAAALFFTAGELHSLTVEQQMVRAKAKAEAGDYREAIREYQQLLEREKQPWQQAILNYNIARLLQKEKTLQEALAAYRKLPPLAESNPLFAQRIRGNSAVAYWQQLEEATLSKPDADLIQIEKALFILRALFLQLDLLCPEKLADKSLCQATLRNAAETLENILLAEKKSLLPRYLTIEEELLLLQTSLQSFLAEYPLLKASQDKVLQSQRQRIAAEAASWKPLWAAAADKLKGVMDEESLSLFQKGSSYFSRAAAMVEEGPLAASAGQFSAAAEALAQFSKVYFADNPIDQSLHRLTLSYKRAIGMSLITIPSLIALQQQQEALLKLMEKSAPLSRAIQSLEKAIAAAKKGSRAEVSLYLLEGFREVRHQLWQLDDQKENGAEQLLRHAIEEEEIALVINETAMQGEPSTLQQPVVEAQRDPLKLAAQFPAAALALQQEEFLLGRCLCSPWSQLLPLFNAGSAAAADSLRLLGGGEFVKGSAKQEEAIALWKKALKLLEEPPPKEKNQGGGGGGQGQEEKSEELLRLLLQMEQDDRAPEKARGPIKQGKKPW